MFNNPKPPPWKSILPLAFILIVSSGALTPVTTFSQDQGVKPCDCCDCDPCKDMKTGLEEDSLQLPKSGNPAQINLAGTFTNLNNSLIKKVSAEIIYFEIQQTKDKQCAKCVFDSKQYCNFILPATVLSGYSGPVLNKPDYSHLITWTSTVIKDCNKGHGDGEIDNPGRGREAQFDPKLQLGSTGINGPGTENPNNPVNGPAAFNLPISVPDLNALSCCGDVIKICVRYTFSDFCCHTCEVIKCYQLKRG